MTWKSLYDLQREKIDLEAQLKEKQKTIDVLLERNASLQRELMHYDTLAVWN